ncbi:MAG: hypothetical protein ACF8OB_06850 [Phycisphaeraceae bacterium JB051]
MPGIYSVLNDGNLVVEYWAGQVSSDEIIEHEIEHTSDPSIKNQSVCLVDGRNAAFDLTREQIQQMADFSNMAPYGQRHTKVAIVCSDSTAYRQSQLYELSMCKQGVSLITFTNMAVACAWLNVDLTLVECAVDQLKNNLLDQKVPAA